MKKIIINLMLALVMCGILGTVDANAAESDEMVQVVVQVPASWESPCLWAWADDGTNAFAAWPGEAMTKLEDGWYYIYVPGYVQNVIVSANNDSEEPVQIEGLKVDAEKNMWISVSEDKTATVSYEVQNTTAIPEYVEMITVHAYVPLSWKTVNLFAWSAKDNKNAFDSEPGPLMDEGEDGWFTAKAPAWIDTLTISGNEGEVKAEKIAVEGKEVWVTVYEDLTYEVVYEDPEKAAEDITIYAQIPADWEGPKCWAWSAPDGTNAYAAWPGQDMELDGDWYKVIAPGWVNSVIINGNNGTVQTTDLSVEVGKNVWVVVTDPENATITYESPSGEGGETGNGEATEGGETEEGEKKEEGGTGEEVKEETEENTDKPQATKDGNAAASQESEGNGVMIWVIVGVVVVAAVVVCVVIYKKKN